MATSDLHGNAPDCALQALLIIDVINDLEFPGGEQVAKQALPMARAIAVLKKRARAAKVPVIYVNDNFGKWRSDFQAQIQHATKEDVRGGPVARLLRPDPEDYYVLKVKHSGFYASPLEDLLESIGAESLVLAGISAESCVFFTACDAYLRDYEIIIPSDCVASRSAAVKRQALQRLKDQVKADVRKSASIRFRRKRRR